MAERDAPTRKNLITTGNLDAELLPYNYAIVSIPSTRRCAWLLLKLLAYNDRDPSSTEQPFSGFVTEVRLTSTRGRPGFGALTQDSVAATVTGRRS